MGEVAWGHDEQAGMGAIPLFAEDVYTGWQRQGGHGLLPAPHQCLASQPLSQVSLSSLGYTVIPRPPCQTLGIHAQMLALFENLIVLSTRFPSHRQKCRRKHATHVDVTMSYADSMNSFRNPAIPIAFHASFLHYFMTIFESMQLNAP